MIRELTPWLMAATLALSACGDDDDTERCAVDDCTEEEEERDASRPVRSDAAVLEDSAVAQTPRDAGTLPVMMDASKPAEDAGKPADDGSIDSVDSLRQVCVDTINMYRATLSLPPMMRATETSESCSDDGAEFDSKANKAHGSAAKGAVPCRTQAVAQNTCPNWPVRKNMTVADSLKQCLKQMWEEGEPPQGTEACIKDKVCFPKYGHWINMTSSAKLVSCGFFENEKHEWWMNQDFSGR